MCCGFVSATASWFTVPCTQPSDILMHFSRTYDYIVLILPYPFCGDLVNPHPFIPEFYNHNPSVVLQGIPRGTTRVEISHRNQLGNNQRKVEISTVRAPLFFSVNIAPTLLRRAHTLVPAGRRETEKSTGLDISRYHAEWQSLQMTELKIS